jgi:glutathione S-transferase
MSSYKPITLYSHAAGPNPWKVAIILEELELPYENTFPAPKEEPYLSINPNGRLPAIDDPNTGIKIWESGAIIQYLIENYDKEGKISYGKTPERWYENQWLAFQISGQGPYFGQAAWFGNFHPEKLPSATERYIKEIERVTMVLDTWLQKNEYLVGDKCTYADLSFVTWAAIVPWLTAGQDVTSKYKAYTAWMGKLTERPSVKKVLADKAAASKGH